jgi:hypothetical protein
VERRPERGREALDVAVVVGVNLLVVSPYLFMLLRGYPFLEPLPRNVIPIFSPHLIEGALAGGGLLLAAAAWGGRVLWQRGDRLSRLWLAQALAALTLWAGHLLLSVLHQARERDESYQGLRFTLAILAGIGAWDLVRRGFGGAATRWRELLGPQRGDSIGAREPRPAWTPAARAVCLCLVLLPFSLPAWWQPMLMDPYFGGSLQPLPEARSAPGEWLARHSRPGEVVAGDHDYAVWAAALSGRRTLLSAHFHKPPGYAQRMALERDLLRGEAPQRAQAAAATFGVRYLVVTQRLLWQQGVALESLLERQDLELGYLARGRVRSNEPLAVFRLRSEAAP